MASHGFVVIRVDMRGSGDSTGFYYDEYVAQEQKDACNIIGKKAWKLEFLPVVMYSRWEKR